MLPVVKSLEKVNHIINAHAINIFQLGYFQLMFWDFDPKCWIVDFFTCYSCKKTPQNNFKA